MASNINSTIPVAGANLLAEPIRNNFAAAKSEIESIQTSLESALHSNTPAQIGGINDYVNVAEDGTITLVGNATVWDDITPGIAASKTSGPGVSFNTTEITLEFVSNADLNDWALLPFQLSHRVKAGSSIYPHIHWEQTQNIIPNWLIRYRWQRNGQSKTTSWSNYRCNIPAFTYISGTLNQICYGAAIPAPTDYGISDILQLRVLRDNTNASGVFTGADTYSGTASITSFDPHVEFDTLGSKTEYSK